MQFELETEGQINSTLFSESKNHPLETSSYLNQWLFVWMNSIIKSSKQKPWEQEMHDDLPKHDQFEEHSKLLYERVVHRRLGMLYSLIVYHKRQIAMQVIGNLIYNLISISSSYFLSNLIKELSSTRSHNRGSQLETATLSLLAIILTSTISTLILSKLNFENWRLSLVWRSSLMICIFEKTMKYNTLNQSAHGEGSLLNYIQVDAAKFEQAGYSIIGVLTSVVGTLFSIILGIYLIGHPVILMVSVMAFMNIGLYFTSRLEKKMNERIMRSKDKRISFMKNILNNIKFIKTKAWENLFHYRLYQKREEEIKALNLWGYVVSFALFLNWVNPSLAMSSIFIYKIYISDEPLNVGEFSGFLKIVTDLRLILVGLFWNISKVIELYVGIMRIKDFLIADELNDYSQIQSKSSNKEHAIILKDGEFSWKETTILQVHDENAPRSFKLTVPNIQIKKNKLTLIVGSLGSGKSTLLYALAGQINSSSLSGAVSPQLIRYGSSIFLSQRPWILSDTIENNITLNEQIDRVRFDEAIELSQFKEDLESMQDGIHSIVGENGQNLSGGQRTRLCLARCIYHQPDIFILDDPLSALDMNVADKIMKNFTSKLAGSTRIMATNALHHIKFADEIIYIKNGEIIYQGDREELTKLEIFNELFANAQVSHLLIIANEG